MNLNLSGWQVDTQRKRGNCCLSRSWGSAIPWL